MSHWDSSISRIGINIQVAQQLTSFPCWGSDFLAPRIGSYAGWLGDGLGAARFGPPAWAGQAPGGNLVRCREFLHAMGRYPRYNKQIWRYGCDLDVGGITTWCAVSIWAAGLALSSHRDIDAGGTAGYIDIERIRIISTDGTVRDLYPNQRIFNINGWGDKWTGPIWKWSTPIWSDRPIQRIEARFIVAMGDEGYHDIGDGSPGWDWGPTGIIGSPNMGCGYNFRDPYYGHDTGFVDIERTYRVQNPNGTVQLLPAESAVGRVGIRELIGNQGGGGYRSMSMSAAGSLW